MDKIPLPTWHPRPKFGPGHVSELPFSIAFGNILTLSDILKGSLNFRDLSMLLHVSTVGFFYMLSMYILYCLYPFMR